VPFFFLLKEGSPCCWYVHWRPPAHTGCDIPDSENSLY